MLCPHYLSFVKVNLYCNKQYKEGQTAHTLKDFKNAETENNYFCIHTFLAFFNRLKRMVTTLCFYLYPILVFRSHWLPPAMHCWFTMLCRWRPYESMKKKTFYHLTCSL